MSDIKNVQLGFSCPFKVEDMVPTENGRYCSGCSKEVIDFTHKSQSELQSAISSSKTGICGSFKPSQLTDSFLKLAAATALAATSILASGQDMVIAPGDSIVDVETITGDVVELGIIEINNTTPAEPRGGIENFYLALKKHLRYPAALEQDGKVYLELRIDSVGNVSDVKILKGLGPEADQEAIRAVKAAGTKFNPAEENGSPVSSRLIFPVIFVK